MSLSDHKPLTASGDTGWKVLTGWQFTETGGGSAQIKLRDNGASGTVFMNVKLVAGESVGDQYSNPIRTRAGTVYAELTSGTADMFVYGRSE